VAMSWNPQASQSQMPRWRRWSGRSARSRQLRIDSAVATAGNLVGGGPLDSDLNDKRAR
jgi:hypothetical protein